MLICVLYVSQDLQNIRVLETSAAVLFWAQIQHRKGTIESWQQIEETKELWNSLFKIGRTVRSRGRGRLTPECGNTLLYCVHACVIKGKWGRCHVYAGITNVSFKSGWNLQGFSNQSGKMPNLPTTLSTRSSASVSNLCLRTSYGNHQISERVAWGELLYRRTPGLFGEHRLGFICTWGCTYWQCGICFMCYYDKANDKGNSRQGLLNETTKKNNNKERPLCTQR